MAYLTCMPFMRQHRSPVVALGIVTFPRERHRRLGGFFHRFVDQHESSGWHTIHVLDVGKKITCTVDGKHKLEATDDTFTKPGAVELLAKADTQNHFDQFKAAAINR
jgi:hypothetical protein